MKTSSMFVCTFLSACVAFIVTERSDAASHLSQAFLGQTAVMADCGCAQGPVAGDSYGYAGDEMMDYSYGSGGCGVGGGCGCGIGGRCGGRIHLRARAAALGLNTASRAACVGRCGIGRIVHGSALNGLAGGKVTAIASKMNPKYWMHTPTDTGAGSWFNCGCNGSYKFPVPPLSTYHWPGMFSHQLMTDYQSPWRFPAVRPFGKEHGPMSYDFVPPTDAEPVPSGDHEPVSYTEEYTYSADADELASDVRPMSEVMADLYGK